jgi:MOSC domain-containing protein YiiM
MNTIGTVESLWRYPVKSYARRRVDEMFAGYSGVAGVYGAVLIEGTLRKGDSVELLE